MKKGSSEMLLEIHQMLKSLVDGQQLLIKEIRELREEQKKLREEIRLTGYSMGNMAVKSEIIN